MRRTERMRKAKGEIRIDEDLRGDHHTVDSDVHDRDKA